tara:strand:- start:6523 stop:7131 length:609 start_codon:yes stop_codon:yes gene_type:complete
MTTANNTRWNATLTAPEHHFAQTFEGLCDNGDKDAWTQARDFLVDEALEAIDNHMARAIADLLCDANPDEEFQFSHSGFALNISAVSEHGPYTVERFMPEVVVVRDDGTPVATFHVTDDFDDETPGIDEAEAMGSARFFCQAFNARASTPWMNVEATRFDGSTYQITALIDGIRQEIAVVSGENLDDDELDNRARLIADRLS